MPKVIFIAPDSSRRELESPAGWSVMEAAIQNDVLGIVAECGGGCACATCHVIVDEAWAAQLAPASPNENDLLECTAAPRTATSRLSCQLKISASLDGLTVQIPDRQT
ncbi:MAG: 2Fe-2S iron-sulfur cluster binding domain-containing protein [Gammaproteobacteria bacterium]|nr:2Fe-2S iron-sulfur cluster binding domain-containing protein [Gammaproteobacteria bacterium]